MKRPVAKLALAAGLLSAPVGAQSCLAYHPHLLQEMTAAAVACPPQAVNIDGARSVLGATLWEAQAGPSRWRCAARHNFDGPTRVSCLPQSPPPAAP